MHSKGKVSKIFAKRGKKIWKNAYYISKPTLHMYFRRQFVNSLIYQ